MNKLLFLLLVFPALNLFAQEDPKWDDTKSKDWPEKCQLISIKSSVDGKEQPAYFYKTESNTPRPLVVSLHSWSGGWKTNRRNNNLFIIHYLLTLI